MLFKSQTSFKPNVVSEANGIYVRNDGSNHRVIPKTPEPPVTDDLDELLALDKPALPEKKTLPKPGSIKKSSVPEPSVDDEAWLDDILG